MSPATPGVEGPPLLVYRHVGCPYCERVVRVLLELDLPYVSRFVVPRHSDRNVVKRVSGRRTVPVLVDEAAGVTMTESANIVEYLQRTYGPTAGYGAESEHPYGFDVVDLPPADPVEVGEPAPDFTRPLVGPEYWEDVALSDLAAEGPVLVVFYPMDGTGSAKYTWIELRERGWDALDPTVVGVSTSSVYEHRAFLVDYDLPFRLYSDPGNGVAEAYGVDHELDGMSGVAGARPAHVLVDEDLVVRDAWAASTWPARRDYDALEAALAEVAGSPAAAD